MPLDEVLLDAIAGTIAETERDFRGRLEKLGQDIEAAGAAEQQACRDRIEQVAIDLSAQIKELGVILEKARAEGASAAGIAAATTTRIRERLDAITERLEGTDGIEAALRVYDGQILEQREAIVALRTDLDAGLARMTDAVRERLREERLELSEDLLAARRRYDGMSTDLEERLAALKDGEPGPPGPAGPPGSFDAPEPWRDRIFYQGELAFLDGSTFCAKIDTAQRPPHDDWAPVALRGTDGRAGEARGLYDPQVDYFKLDRVALDGSEWIARQDDPGPLPGDGWMLGARAGSKGKPGDRGPAGPKGSDGIGIAEIDVRDFAIMLELSDGRSTKIDLRPLFERYHQERGG